MSKYYLNVEGYILKENEECSICGDSKDVIEFGFTGGKHGMRICLSCANEFPKILAEIEQED